MTKKSLSLIPLHEVCPHCGISVIEHLVIPDNKQCVHMQDKGWLTLNKEMNTKRASLSIRRKVIKNEIPISE